MPQLTLEALLENLQLALSAGSELNARDSTLAIVVEVLQLLEGTVHEGSELKIAVSSFHYDDYGEDVLVGAEIIDIPFVNSYIGVPEDFLGVEEGCKIQVVLIEIELTYILAVLPWMRMSPSLRAQW